MDRISDAAAFPAPPGPVRCDPLVRRAAHILGRGGVVAFPTETVYGLGADADCEAAVQRIFSIKGRPRSHPLIVHLADWEAMDRWASPVPDLARQLARRWWPGPLTLILPRHPRVSGTVTGGAPTIGLRVPNHPLALALLREFGGGIAAPSANRFGAVSPTSAQHVRDDLGEEVDLVLDGGPCTVGVESTIVDLTAPEPVLLRPGGIARAELEATLGRPLRLAADGRTKAPGTLPHHYAPRARVILTQPDAMAEQARTLIAKGLRVGLLTTDRPPPGEVAAEALVLPSDPDAMARDLYRALREFDRRGCQVVLASVPAEAGLGEAVADRLRRAAAAPSPREVEHV